MWFFHWLGWFFGFGDDAETNPLDVESSTAAIIWYPIGTGGSCGGGC